MPPRPIRSRRAASEAVTCRRDRASRRLPASPLVPLPCGPPPRPPTRRWSSCPPDRESAQPEAVAPERGAREPPPQAPVLPADWRAALPPAATPGLRFEASCRLPCFSLPDFPQGFERSLPDLHAAVLLAQRLDRRSQ